MSYRMKITLPAATLAELRTAARDTGEPMARIVTRLVTAGLSAGDRGDEGPAHMEASTAPTPGDGSGRRARWLEPLEGERAWRRDMWGAIVALYGRYPRELGHLKDGWWNDATHVETLCALVAWRDWIDQVADDPRHELAFHAELEDYSRALRQEGGGVAAAWQPGAAPNEWA